MLRWLTPKLPPRSVRRDYTDIILDNGRSRIVFNSQVLASRPPTSARTTRSPHIVENHLPPAPSSPSDFNTPNSSLCPPFHIHLKEDETFHVISGTAKFLLLDQRRSPPNDATTTTQAGLTTHLAAPGTTLTIPRGQIHTFRNASTTQPLHIEFGFSPPVITSSNSKPTSTTTAAQPNDHTQRLNTKMHRFFLNTQLYRSDCTTHSIPRSLPQVLLFNHHADVTLVPAWLLAVHRRVRLPILRALIEQMVAPALGRLMNVVGGVVLGKYVFALRASYLEYYPYPSTHTHTHSQVSVRAADTKDKPKPCTVKTSTLEA